MRIGIITSWPTDVIGGSGTAVFFNSFVAGLRERGHTLEIVAPNFDISDYIDVTLRRFLFNTQLRTDPRIQQADVLIGFDFDGYGLDPASRPPLVASAHAIFADVLRFETDPVRTMVQAQAFFDRVNMEQAEHITAGSEYAKRRLIELYGLPAHKITAIAHGMMQPSWLPLVGAAPRTPNDHPIVLAVGKMYPRKRVDVLLRAVPLLVADHPNVEVRIVGDGLEYEPMRTLAAELGVERHVTFLGHIADDAAFAREWRQADVFAHASHQESFGYVYLEAMQVGLPIVAINASAAPEVIGDAGLLAEPENPASMAAAISRFLSDPAMRAEYGRRGQIRAQRFTLEHMIDGYERVIEVARAKHAEALRLRPAV